MTALTASSLFAGGIVLDGSFGTAGPLPGPNYMISAGAGKTVGNNLFHSFNQFNLVNTESATFTGPSNIQNIVSRVTGGSPSSIDGTIRSEIQGANLFFLNPAGVMFGPNTRVDVSGSFAVSTANYLKLADGGRFNASLGGQDNLTSAPISAFGFLNAPQPIRFDHSQLAAAPGTGLHVIAGDVTLDGATLQAPSGVVRIFSAASAGEESFNADSSETNAFSALGNINVTNGSSVNIDGNGGGILAIRGGNLVVDGSTLSSATRGDIHGGDIKVEVDTELSVVNGGQIVASTYSAADGGEVDISANRLRVSFDSSIKTAALFDVTVSLDIEHTFDGDLKISLMGPGGTVVTLMNQVGDDGHDIHTTFSDSAPVSIDQGTAPFNGTYRPETPLSTFNGTPTRGTWTLSVTDSGPGDVGTLQDWALEIGGHTFTSSDVPKPINDFENTTSTIAVDLSFPAGRAGDVHIHTVVSDVVLDGSFGTSGGLPAPNYIISADLGRQVGTNLFHSFDRFDLLSFESAIFTGPSDIQNIISRVTGGSPSSIDGTIRSDIQGANLFFLNPFGVMFGPNAQLDVSGSFAVTTANYVKMVGGGRFNANLGGADTLTSTPVSTFGFLNPAPAPVSINGSALNITPQRSVSVIAGDITLDGTQLSAPGGNVVLFSARASGEVGYDDSAPGAHFRDSTLSGFGNISFRGGATVAIDSTEGGGKIAIRGGHVTITESSTISSINQGVNVGGDVELTADVLSVLNGASIEAQALSDGAGGNLSVQSTDITVDGDDGSNRSSISSTAESGSGHAGNLVLNATNLALTNGAGIFGSSFSQGRGADITITASTIGILGFTTIAPGIFAEAMEAGNGGNIHIDVTALNIGGSGEISTRAFASGRGGDISIHAGSLSIDGSATPGEFTGIDTTSEENQNPDAGDAGNVTIVVDHMLSILAHAVIQTATFSTGNGGDLTIAAGSLLLDGSNTPGLRTGISTGTAGTDVNGNAGNLSISVNHGMSLLGGAVIDASTFSKGDAGNVTVSANSLLIDHDAFILSGALGNGNGHGGDITVEARDLRLTNGGAISTNTRSAGQGGNLSVKAGSLTIDGDPSFFETGIFANASDLGDAGDVFVRVDGALKMVGANTVIGASTGGSGEGGDVFVHAKSISITGVPGYFAGIAASSSGTRDGGQVTVIADSALRILRGGSIQSITSFSGRGGNVLVEAGSLRIGGSGISAQTQSVGDAGAVKVVVNGPLTIVGGGTIDASSSGGTGNAGDVVVTTDGPLTLKNRAGIETSAPLSEGGSIAIFSRGTISLFNGSDISASAGGAGGNIHITAPDLVYLLDSEITATAGTSGKGGTGGNITIDPQFIILNNSPISANAAVGQGGNINLVSNFFFTSNSPVTATGAIANGTVNITAPELDLGAQLITLPASLVSAENQLRERCTALLQGDFSSFISLGRGGTEQEPQELEPAF